jgi:hypothetical protein
VASDQIILISEMPEKFNFMFSKTNFFVKENEESFGIFKISK